MAAYDKIFDFGRYSSVPAGMIDRYYLEEGSNIPSHVATFIKVRAVYLFLFLPAAGVDLLSSGVAAFFTGLGVLWNTDKQQAGFLKSVQHYTTLFTKNLYALLASPFGLISPKLTAFYFTEEKRLQKGVTAGGHYHQAANAEVKKVESIEDVQELVQSAVKNGKKVMPRGAGFSQGKQYLPEGEQSIVLDLDELNTIEINASEKTVKVGAGARWSDIQLEANKHKLALKVMQASNVFSVGGSIGTNIHGWDHQTGMLSTTIRSMEIVDANGERKTITPADPLFHHVAGGLGLYGIVVSVTMELTDNELLKETSVKVAPKDYVKYFTEQVLTDPNHRMHLYRLSLDPSHLLGEGVAVSYVKELNTKSQKTSNLAMEAPQGTRFDRVMINLARRFDWVRRFYWNGERDRLLSNTSEAMTTNEIMQPAINAMLNPSVSEAEWLQEYFLPGEALDSFLQDLGHILMANGVPLLNASVRYVKQQDDSPFSYARGGDRFAVVLCFNQSLSAEAVIQARKWLRASQHLAVKKGGTYYLPYQQVSSPDDFAKAYPQAREAANYKDQVDPQHVFTSGFYQRYMAPQEDRPNYFKIMMASADMKKEFEGFLKNVLQRVDCETFYKLLDDVMTYTDSHEEIYQELSKRLPEIMPSAVVDLSHVLTSLSAIKGDLGEQARALLPKDVRKIDGLVEIGYPGRFINGFKERYEATGDIIAVCEQESLSDYVQTGYPRPYTRFKPLNYLKPELSGLADNSAEVITCYVGLHHFPPAEMVTFLNDVRRVLKPGGHFLLVDHDVTDEKTMTMAHMAHSVFNAVTGASLQDELTERRDFKSMQAWQDILKQHDLINDGGTEQVMIRKGDPSRNRMVSFSRAGLKFFPEVHGELETMHSETPVQAMGR